MAKTWKKDVAGFMAALMVISGFPMSSAMAAQTPENSVSTFKTVSGGDVVEGEIVYTYDDIDMVTAWEEKPIEGPTVSFGGNYSEFWLKLPEAIPADSCEKLNITVSGQEGTLCFKLYDAARNDLGTYYNQQGQNEYSIMPKASGDITQIGIMSNDESAEYPFGVTFEKLTVKLSGDTTTTTSEIVYQFDELNAYNRWSSGDKKTNPLTYGSQYEEIVLEFPEAIADGACKNVKVNVTGEASRVAVKLYGPGFADLGVQYGTTSIAPQADGDVTAVAVMFNDTLKEEEENFQIAVDNVTITVQSTEGGGEEETIEVPFGVNIIQSPNFTAEDDLSVWAGDLGDGAITSQTAAEPIFDDVTTYGAISGRGTNYNCFAQDITKYVEKNQEYQFEFYAMLDAEDYADAPASQRTVQFAPFIVVNGEANYGPTIAGTTSQVLTPGEWTKFSGTFTPSWVGKKVDRVVVRLLEQGENYGQGDGVKGKYYVTGVSLMKVEKEPIHIQEDIPDWKDAITGAFGTDTIAGTAMTLNEFSDEALSALVNKHFNAVTFGNELKPDSVFGYSNSKCPGTENVTLNGEELVVPTLNFSRGDQMADQILAWNEAHPESPIKVRGHVLVWHSQTPEWFFHEGYDKTNPYASKEEMTKRQEWYIKSVLEHYVGADSKYKDLFYGWDVVNEAVSDATGTYRGDNENPSEDLSTDTHGSNSSWWHVYESNEYIINAFKFANKYAPASLELYYNDYNETMTNKARGIQALLTAVKNAEGTRIDGMGMQAHYNVDGFNAAQFEDAARAYAGIVGKIQLTELDFKASSGYDGSDAAKESEYQKIALCHKQVFDSLKSLKAEGVKVGGIIIWGVIEPNSWLHSQSGVGGGANGSKQCPLLFDGNYMAKPAYWAYVDDSLLNPVIQTITIAKAEAGVDYNEVHKFSKGAVDAAFTANWDENGIKFEVTVTDASADDTDSVTVYVDSENKAGDITPIKKTITRAQATAVEGGYKAVVEIPVSGLAITKTVGFDVVVKNAGEAISFNDTKNTQETSSKFYAKAVMKPGVKMIPKGTVKVDGTKDAAWKESVQIPLTISLNTAVTANANLLWDDENLYVYAEIKDSVLNADSADDYQKDSLEVFVDENNHKTATYEADDKQYRVNYLNEQSYNGQKCEGNMTSAITLTEDGYIVEAAYKWTDISPKAGDAIGLELQVNDANATGKRVGTLSWNDETGMGWSSTAVYGTAILGSGKHVHEAATAWSSDANNHWHECVANDGERMDVAAHEWNKGVVTTAATCAKKGVKTYTCKVCGKKKTESIPATGNHTYTTKVTKATTKEDGKITKTCSVCGKVTTKKIYKIKSATLSKKEFTYDGKAKKPAVTVKDSKGNVLVKGTDYSVTYSDNKLPGKATATIKFKGNYKATVKKTFKIYPKATVVTVTAKTKAFGYKIKKDSKVSGYQLQYSTDKSFAAKKTVTKTIKGYENISGTIKSLKAGTKYYVRVRSYKTVGSSKYCSKWSKSVTVKTK